MKGHSMNPLPIKKEMFKVRLKNKIYSIEKDVLKEIVLRLEYTKRNRRRITTTDENLKDYEIYNLLKEYKLLNDESLRILERLEI